MIRRRFLQMGAILVSCLSGFAAIGFWLFRRALIPLPLRPLFRPPGALPEIDFLNECTHCDLCLKACPTGLLRRVTPEESVVQAGTPQAVFDPAYCQADCRRCMEVCPTDALLKLTPSEKELWKLAQIRFDPEHCLLTFGRECSICFRECPREAISLVWSDEDYLALPVIDPSRCNGCGHCVCVCPGDPDHLELSPLKAFIVEFLSNDA